MASKPLLLFLSIAVHVLFLSFAIHIFLFPLTDITPLFSRPEQPLKEEALLVQEIFTATNQERQQRGLPPLYLDEQLSAVARAHSQDMLSRMFFNHTNPDGENATARTERHALPTSFSLLNGSAFSGIGENLIFVTDDGFCSEQHPEFSGDCFVDLWMDSDGHRMNILQESYGVIGIGVVCTDIACYATQNFRAGGENVLLAEYRVFSYEDTLLSIVNAANQAPSIFPFSGGFVVQTDDESQIWSSSTDASTLIITDARQRVSATVSSGSTTYTVR